MKTIHILFASTLLAFGLTGCGGQKPTEETTAKSKEPMEKTFKKIDPKELPDNVIKLIADDWMLITAGTKDSFNMMTASWGTIGNLWNEPVATCYIRPQRHTRQFIDNSNYFTLTFFAPEYKNILQYCGTKSGKDVDKIKETGLIPVTTYLGNIYYKQARVVLECEILYADDIKGDKFTEPKLSDRWYADKDFSRMYIGKIVNCWIEE